MKRSTLFVLSLVIAGCGLRLDETEEVGHAAGDVLASLDETSQGGQFALTVPMHRHDLGAGGILDRAAGALWPSAYAAGCWGVTFGACTSGVRTKDLGGCTIGGCTLDGSVTLAFSSASCSLASVADSVTRTADFTLTGRRGATLHVTSPGGGQKVTRTATGWTYQVLGLHREMTGAAGRKLFDIDTQTLEDIVVTGFTRSTRVVSGGELQIRHNLAKYTTLLTPEQLAWSATCNCPVSGTLGGTVTHDGEEPQTASIEITGCGTATVTLGSETRDVSFDRCAGI